MDVKVMEIVAPAGSAKALEAAIAAGADAVYLGLKGFGARRRAQNFLMDELLEYIDYAHIRGVRVFLTLNTLMKDIEIESLYSNIKGLYERGIDSFIVQDLGLFEFLKKNFQDIDIHASTQMSAKNGKEAEFLRVNGFKRVVLARELSFDLIEKVRKESSIELEVFVSGAMCVSYSGKCYMSSFIGGRSGNRGLCAQPCRKSYKSEKESGYFLSPKDQLLGEKEIKKLMEIGVNSIKIEGRMKDEKYVYETVKYYRNLIDGLNIKSGTEKLFNRGYEKGYFYGKNKNLINREYSFDFGFPAGKITQSGKVKLTDSIICGDGITYIDKEKNVISGEYVSRIINSNGEKVKESESEKEVLLGTIPEGTVEIYKTYDKRVNDAIESDMKKAKRRSGITAKLEINIGEKPILTLRRGLLSINVEGETLTEEAKKPMDTYKIKEKLSEMGETEFFLSDAEILYDGKAFISFTSLKELRNEGIESLKKEIIEKSRRRKDEKGRFTDKAGNRENSEYIVAALARNKEQEEILKKVGIEKIYRNYSEKNIAESLDEIEKENIKAVDWTMNIFNSYTYSFYKKFKNIETVYLSPELSYNEIGEINSYGKIKGAVVYGKMRVMKIESDILEDGTVIKNEERDSYKVVINSLGNSEIYMEKPLIADVDKLLDAGVGEIRFDFTDETDEEIENIVRDVLSGMIEKSEYNYEKGVF